MDPAWLLLVARVERGELGDDDTVATAVEEAALEEATALEHARRLIGRFWDMVHDDPGNALAEATLAIAVCTRFAPDGKRTLAQLERRRAIALFSLGRGKESVAAGERGVAILSALDPTQFEVARLRAALLGFLGNAHLSQGDVTKALVALEEAIAIARAHSLDAELGVFLSSLGNTRVHSGDLVSGESYYEEALRIAVDCENKEGEAVNTGNLGLVKHALGDLDGALEHYERALDCARDLGDRRSAATLEANVGVVFFDRGDLAGARARYEVSLDLARALHDRSTESVALLKLASVAREQGEFDQADALLADAAAALDAVEDPRRSPFLDELGRVLLARGEPRAAGERFTAALTSAREVGDRRGEAISLYDLGRAAAALGEASDALAHLHEAVAVASELDARELTALAQVAQAELHLGSGDRTAASTALAAAEREAQRRGHVLATRFAFAQARSVGLDDPDLAHSLLADLGERARRQGFFVLADEAERRAEELQ
jgi:tetratricopeptide (TPR) repeat protein